MVAYAHSLNVHGTRHELAAHLRGVADLAATFARPFNAEELARVAGLCHDLGKFHPDFQRYLEYCEQHPGARGPRVDHKAAGASSAQSVNPLLPLLIRAHHGGLGTWTDLQNWLAEPTVARRIPDALASAMAALPELRDGMAPIPLPSHISTAPDADLFARMLFSCLVDADFLDTEQHFGPDRTHIRERQFDAVALLERLRSYRAALNPDRLDDISRLRRSVAETCEAAGEGGRGIYRMTVPTGGGKTLAGMAFALRHAAARGHQRVIVGIPYTSITEQTAEVYRQAFAAERVLEHHSAAQWTEPDDDEPTQEHVWQRLAAENWDAPIVVTTTVQLFESLLGRRVSSSRKIHNLANSVLILDEVQMLPPKYIVPILDVLRGLVDHFGTTVLLSTATQPAFQHAAFRELPEIAPNPAALFDVLRRVEYELAPDAWSWGDAADALRREHQAMMVLNTKRDARTMLDALADSGALHLSTQLCGAHRRDVLAEVKQRLLTGKECRLVTTQVVEAGVDLDFPAVFRVMGPLDRIIQAAGRCNREGRLDRGRMTVFRPAEGGLPVGAYRTATQLTEKHFSRGLDLHDPDAVVPYFANLHRTVDTDAEGIQALRKRMDFPEISRRFRMIEDDTEDVVVPYGSANERAIAANAIDAIRARRGRARELWRQIQPFTVGLRQDARQRAQRRGYVSQVALGLWEWTGPEDLYDPVRGLAAEGADAEVLIG